MPDTQFHGLGSGAAPQDWTLPDSLTMTLKAARAVYDGSAAVGSFLPALEIISDAGLPVGIYVSQTSVAAGDSADVSFAPFLRSPTAPSTGGGTLDQVITSLVPSAWYKLNETVGTTAHDSSVNHFDATPSAGKSAPTWGVAAGPVGGTAAQWTSDPTTMEESSTAFPNLAGGDLTGATWVKFPNTNTARMLGQGTNGPTSKGWELQVGGPASAYPSKLAVVVSTGTSTSFVASDVTLTTGTWYFVAAVLASGVWSLYVNGALQSSTLTLTPGAASGVWMGMEPGGTAGGPFSEQYAMVYNYALTGLEVLRLYNAAIG